MDDIIEIMARAAFESLNNTLKWDDLSVDWKAEIQADWIKAQQASLAAIANSGYVVVSCADLTLLLDEWGRDDPLPKACEAFHRLSDLVGKK